MDLDGLNIKALLQRFDSEDYENIMDLKIYRYFAFDDLINTLSNRRLSLKKPHLWDDPFENLFLKSKVIDTDGSEHDFSLMKEQIYAQCWTLKEESDLMWSKFAGGKKGAKVTTTIGKLLSYILKFHFAFIGKVKYLPENKIIEYFSDILPYNINSVPIFDTLLIKRETFSEEKEVRLVFYDLFRGQPLNSKLIIANNNKDDYCISDVCYIPVEPNELFSEIIFHPRMEDNDINEAIIEIKKHYSGEARKSNLYDIPKITITIDRRIDN